MKNHLNNMLEELIVQQSCCESLMTHIKMSSYRLVLRVLLEGALHISN